MKMTMKLVKSDISGSAILASILREACFVYGDPSLFTRFGSLTYDSLDSSKNSRKGFYNSTLASLSQNIYKLPR